MVFVFGEEERLLQSHLVKIELVNPVQQVCNYAVSKCTVSVYMQASQFKGAELAMFKKHLSAEGGGHDNLHTDFYLFLKWDQA